MFGVMSLTNLKTVLGGVSEDPWLSPNQSALDLRIPRVRATAPIFKHLYFAGTDATSVTPNID